MRMKKLHNAKFDKIVFGTGTTKDRIGIGIHKYSVFNLWLYYSSKEDEYNRATQ